MIPKQHVQVMERASAVKKAIKEHSAMAIRAAEGGTMPDAETIRLNGQVKTTKPGEVSFFWRGIRKFTINLESGKLTVPK